MIIALFLVGPVFPQQSPNPDFQETAVIPSFREVNPRIIHFQTFFKKALNEAYTLVLVRGGEPRPGWRLPLRVLSWNRGDLLGLFLMDSRNPERVWKLAMLPGNQAEIVVEVERADHYSIVLRRTQGAYGIRRKSMKLFFDLGSKRLLDVIEYSPVAVKKIVQLDGGIYLVAEDERQSSVVRPRPEDAVFVTGGVRQRVLERAAGLPAPSLSPFLSPSRSVQEEYLPLGRRENLFVLISRQGSRQVVKGVAERIGEADKLYQLPPSSYEEFARARPSRVADGYGPGHTSIGEVIGPFQVVGDRLWFARMFYDGEGFTGVGGIGYFDPDQRKYVVFYPPELADWSASAILVEDDAVWIGLVRHPEGADFSGGLLRFDPAGGHTRSYPFREIVFTMARDGGTLYLGASEGFAVLRRGRLRRYVFEPALDGGYQIVEKVAGNGQ